MTKGKAETSSLKERLSSPTGLWVAFGLMLAIYLFSALEVSRDNRRVGSLDDLRSMAQSEELNLLFVLVDTLRSDRLGSYGYVRETTPVLDDLARTGVRFARNRAQSSWTKSSMASLWTGLYPLRAGVVRYADRLPDEAVLPVEILAEAGFATAGIWRNGWVDPTFGFGQGFDVYQKPRFDAEIETVRRELRAGRIPGSDAEIFSSAAEFLSSHRDERWFLYLHLMDVHQYVSSKTIESFGITYSDYYDNSVRWTDDQLGRLLIELEGLGLREKTLVVVVSDHGEAFGEHGLEGHAKDLHAEVTRTPWILGLPFQLEGGVVVETPTENVDVWPTLLDLLGLPGLDSADGVSRTPEILGEARASGDTTGIAPSMAGSDLAHLNRGWGRVDAPIRHLLAIRVGAYRAFYDQTRPEQMRVYHILNDPEERLPLVPADLPSGIWADLRKRMDEAMTRSPEWAGVPEVELDDLDLRLLRALGYAIEPGEGARP